MAMLNKATFENPPAAYRPIPFWFWNSKLTPDEIERQLLDFHDKGIGGVFIHARFGLETSYMSREWMKCILCAVSAAEKLGMEIWLYDENAFPSGVGDLKVSRIPEYRSKFVDLTERDVSSREKIDIELPPGRTVLAYAYPAGNSAGERIDLEQCVCNNRLEWTAPGGSWKIAVFTVCVLTDPNDIVFGVDYLNPEAMRYFFDITLEPYKEALGDHFGKTIKGVFTDEPTLLPWHHDINWYGRRPHTRVVVWSDLVETEMIERNGLAASQYLPHLFFEIDESTREVRRAFWRAVSDLYIKAFFGPYRKWLDANNLKFTGHVLFEEGLYLNTDFQADITQSLAHLHIPGTDHLGLVTETPYGGFNNTPKHLTNLQGQKLVSSIAHHAGGKTVLSETYGCAGWSMTFEQMKWIADWQYTLGINLLCPHALFYSIEGFRKSDAPPSENHMAGWKHYRGFSDYIGRLSYLLREGVHRAKVALFYPLERFWGEHIVGEEGVQDRVLSDSFDLCAGVLPQLHFDYDIVSQQTLASAAVQDGRLIVVDEEYEVLIASPLSLCGQALEVVREFLGSGGALILPPISADSASREDMLREIDPVLAAVPEQEAGDGSCHVTLYKGELGSKIIGLGAGTSDRGAVAAALESALRECVTPDVEICAADGTALPDVRYVHRVSGTCDIYFVANTAGRPVDARISLEAVGAVEIWDPETGQTNPPREVVRRGDRSVVSCALAPFGSRFVVVHTHQPTVEYSGAAPDRAEVWTFGNEWRFHTESPNALILDEWTFGLRTHGSGCEYEYATTFRSEFEPTTLLLMLDDIEYRTSLMGGMEISIEVNGVSWQNPEFGRHIDRGFKTLDISSAVAVGENYIRLTISHSAWSGQPSLLNAPPVLLGDFSCDRASRTIFPPAEAMMTGSWNDFGYPFFAGTGVYTQSFRIPENPPDGRLLLWVDSARDLVEAAINGVSAGVRLWRPWEFDVTDLVKPGHNLLELRVTNSMVGFLEGNAQPSGLMGNVRLLAES